MLNLNIRLGSRRLDAEHNIMTKWGTKPKNILIPVISFLSQIIVVNNVAIVKKRFLDVERNLQFLRLRINKKCLTLYFLMNVCWENSAPP